MFFKDKEKSKNILIELVAGFENLAFLPGNLNGLGQRIGIVKSIQEAQQS